MVQRKLILRNFLSPGDLVMLTAAVRDLHRCHPGKFLTDVRTSCPELWLHNPHLTPLRDEDAGVEQIDCHYPLIDRSNEAPYHCIHGFANFLSSQLKLDVHPTLFAGDIHLSAQERRWKSAVQELAGRDLPFWIINAGGKFDFTIKWWDWRRYQRVVDHFRGKILFVQVGEIGHYHPPLKHVVDLRGRTDLRELVRLVYHAQGVLCGVTALMHLAAAVPTRPDRPASRAAVIVAGGREPTHWEAYPQHQFIHTVGALSCCTTGGCWRARTFPIGDGEESDEPGNICSNVVQNLPRCMDMITASDVIRRIETYFTGGTNSLLTAAEFRAAERAVTKTLKGPRLETTINLMTAPAALENAACTATRLKPPTMSGHGVILFASNAEDLEGVMESARSVRALDAKVSMECWLADVYFPGSNAQLSSLGVTIRCAKDSDRSSTFTRPELRLHALMNSALQEVIVLEPGVILHSTPKDMLEHRAFRSTGVLFPARGSFRARRGIWKLCKLPAPTLSADTPLFLIDRHRSWFALSLWRWIVERVYFFKGYVDGDGGAAQLAFAKLGRRVPLSLSARAFSRLSSAP